MTKYVYVAINAKTGKPCLDYSPQTDPGDVFREIVESDSRKWGKYNVGKFDLVEPVKIYPFEKSDYHFVDDPEDS